MEDKAVEGLYHLNISLSHLYLEDVSAKYNVYVDLTFFQGKPRQKLLA